MAETYNIYDYKKLPALKVASFCVGLRDDSRVKMKLANTKLTIEQSLLMSIFDQLNILIWSKTKDGSKGRNAPKSLIMSFKDSDNDEIKYLTSEDFMKARNKLLRKD
ncbi:DUF5361 domain-containing protein [Microaceticoccus formicicus]|uniref:DUF5361 domain-containing protein n=1 Tax=Microaceticoccus formicicus TaxID=3118105 RepID=UPI003CD036F5|nr:DUF5361 domain-containing protein [Peptoniphilaceae bacterium AMB_02]